MKEHNEFMSFIKQDNWVISSEDLQPTFVRTREYDEITSIMQKDQYRISVFGSAGSGKSLLLKMILNSSKNSYESRFYKGRDLDSVKLNQFTNDLTNNDSCFLIDGIDESLNPQELFRAIAASNVKKVVCTSRLSEFNRSTQGFFDHIIQITPFSFDQTFELFKKLGLEDHHIKNLLAEVMANRVEATPRSLIQYISSQTDLPEYSDFLAKFVNFHYQYGEGIDFIPPFQAHTSNFIVPSDKLLTKVSVINESLLKKVKHNPAILHGFTPREFETFMRDFFCEQGFDVKLTKQTHDGGKDLIVLQKTLFGNFLTYVECKKYSRDKPVGVNLVRELYGAVEADAATSGLLVTTSYFTNDAKRYTEGIQNRMKLIDYTELVKAISDTNVKFQDSNDLKKSNGYNCSN